MAVNVHLWGELGDRFLPEIRLEVSTFREARLALCSVFPGFKHWVFEHPEYQYSIVVKGVNWEKELDGDCDEFPLNDLDLHVVPVLQGSGKVIGGLALVAIGAFTGQWGLAISGLLMAFGGNTSNKPKAPDPQSNFLNQGSIISTEGTNISLCCGITLMKTPVAISYQVKSDIQS
jgi:hypothetical protein